MNTIIDKLRGALAPPSCAAGGVSRSAYAAILAPLALLVVLSGCTSANTFPGIVRAGGSVTVMVGSTENARKETIDVTLTDSIGQTFNLRTLGKVRSVFNLRTDGRAYGQHYSPYLDSYISWSNGHEPVQTVLVADIPAGAAVGQANLAIDTHVSDNSSGIASPFNVALEIIAGTGQSEQFLRRIVGNSTQPVDFPALEPAPHAKISFGSNGTIIGAASLVVGFNTLALNPNDINIFTPESNVRGSFSDPGAFGATQRMVYWHQDGAQLYIDVVAPQGIDNRFLKLYLVHPKGLSGAANFSIVSATLYDVNGNVISNPPSLAYFQ